MPEIVAEGRRVINNITRAASLFLMKTLFSFGLSVLMLFFPGAYPFQPIQMSLVSSLMVGIPGFFLALEPNDEQVKGNFLKTILGNALPGGIAVTVCASAAMALSGMGWDRNMCSTIATILAGIVSYTVLVLTCMPLNKLRIAILSAMGAAFVLACVFLKKVFFLVPLDGRGWTALAILGAVGVSIVLIMTRVIRKRRK